MVTEEADARREAAAVVAEALAQGRGALDERQAKVLLAGYGIPIPEGGLARTEDEAVAIAHRLDGPVVVKAIGSRIAHKTEHGLVALDLSGEEAVRALPAPCSRSPRVRTPCSSSSGWSRGHASSWSA